MTDTERNLKLQKLDCAIQELELEVAELRMNTQFEVSKLVEYEKCELAKIEYRQTQLGLRKENIHMEFCEAAVTDRFKE